MGGWSEFFVTMFPAHQGGSTRGDLLRRPDPVAAYAETE